MPRSQGFNEDGVEMSSMFVAHDPVDFSDPEPSLTVQEFAEDCDINGIMARYEKTGVISHVKQRQPMYLDLSNVPDLHTAMNVVKAAEVAFMSLPASVRLLFGNDPMEFVKFAEDPENLDQMREWGLAEPAEPTPEPLEVRVVSEPPASNEAPAPAPGASVATPKA